MKIFRTCIPLLIGLSFAASVAYAQSNLDVFFGVGTARDSSSNTLVTNPITGVGTYTTPALGGTFGKAGADILLSHGFGVGGEADFRFGQAGYAGLNYHPIFYDFNGIWAPSFGRIQPEFEAGLGGANLKFYYPASYCDQYAGCSSANQYLESSNHFQVHLSAGVRFYVTPHIFLRPQADIHWVHNFFQFGSNWAPEYSVAAGWSFVGH
ncbi:MAG: hypothetical protein ACRD4O_03155 [Bryobacteraceae bacterium]